MTLKRNTIYCRIVSLLFLIMMVRYREIFSLLIDPSTYVYTMIVVALFYVLNIVGMVGLFIPKKWGFVVSYFAIPISTFLFSTSYFSFIIDWLPLNVRIYVTPFINALLLIGVITLHVNRKRLRE